MKRQSLKFLKHVGLGSVCLVAVAMLSIMSSCSDDDKNVIPEPFTVAIKCSSEAKDTTLVFMTYGDWKASSTKEDMVEIASAKNGVAGEVKMTVHISANTGFAPRTAEIRINDGRTSVNVFNIEQAAALREVNFSKELAFVQTGNVFTDTVTVTSNVEWAIKEPLPAWVKEYKQLDETQSPQEGVDTEIKLVFTGDHSLFKAEGMEDAIVFTASGKEFPLPVAFAGYVPHFDFYVKDAQGNETKVSEVAVEFLSEEYKAKVFVKSNVAWDVISPDWVKGYRIVGDSSANALETSVLVWFDMKADKLDTDVLNGDAKFSDKNSAANAKLTLKFPGVGGSYLDFDRSAIFDKSLPADPYGGDAWTFKFNVYSATMDYHAVIVDYGTGDWLRNTPCQWAGMYEIEDNSNGSRSPILTKKWELAAQGMPNPTDQPRYGMLFVVPSDVTIANLFGTEPLLDEKGEPMYDQWGEPVYKLKPEWEGKGTHFSQAGMELNYYLNIISGITDNQLSIPAEGAEIEVEVETNCDQLSTMFDDEYMSDWIDLDFSDFFTRNVIKFKVSANTTGKSRQLVVKFVDPKDNSLYEFSLRQER